MWTKWKVLGGTEMTKCNYWDCGWCYAPESIVNNSENGACNHPETCPYLKSNKMTKSKYSPETQAVSDAANKAYWLWDEMCPADAHTIAVATLRAAADLFRKAYQDEVYIDHPDDFLYDIAKELEETK